MQKLCKIYCLEVCSQVDGITNGKFQAQNEAEGGEKQKIDHMEENSYYNYSATTSQIGNIS